MKKRKPSDPRRKNLFRVDLNLKYLVYTDRETYDSQDVYEWIKNDFHSGELDEEGTVKVQKVESVEQIQDFLDMDIDYLVYNTDKKENIISIESLVEPLGLDAKILVAKLRKLGYTITPPQKKKL